MGRERESVRGREGELGKKIIFTQVSFAHSEIVFALYPCGDQKYKRPFSLERLLRLALQVYAIYTPDRSTCIYLNLLVYYYLPSGTYVTERPPVLPDRFSVIARFVLVISFILSCH